ncbi:T9SS type A sorting domain-containing protein [Sporocytophaga myxococcoides]|uniref:T9SS type A sorting domain-containing protein n=1 Tax=Sporocytophaga myxococcoides TaxID=153721 RepID=UPI00041CA517|nr:T9SS type A sorting domain-containing protein [Sporocytophaga myxococcoides]
MKKHIQKLFFIVFMVIWGLAVSVAQTHQVAVVSFRFDPEVLNVGPNDTIEFVWPGNGNSSSFHPVKANDNSFASTPGLTSFKVLAKNLSPGSNNPYFCTAHNSMQGTINVSLAASLADLKESKYEFQVTPNPFEDELNLTIFPGNKNVKFIKIFDIIGKEVASIDLSSKVGPSAYKVDFSNLRPGLYFCNVYSDKGIIETRKILRNRS